jgi:predicted enzyme related to lactoylglutathione lyase
MARKKSKKKAARKAPKRAASRRPARRAAKKRVAAKRPARKPAAKRPARKPAAASRPPKARTGWITHTELASADPLATKAWCESVLGWKFGEPMQSPDGPYHMWRFPNDTGGGIRANNPPENPGSIPYCEVAGIRDAYAKAVEHGASEMLPPQEIAGGMGWIAIVAAPGGVAIGFWSMKA